MASPKDHSLTVAMEVLAERDRQRNAEGWTPEHDDAHAHGELAMAAAAYAISAGVETRSGVPFRSPPTGWPWSRLWWKPKNPRQDLIRAAALIIAELERLDRATARPV